jgi:putative protease
MASREDVKPDLERKLFIKAYIASSALSFLTLVDSKTYNFPMKSAHGGDPAGGKEANMPEQKVGEVIKFFSKPSVAAIKVTDGMLAVGDRIKFKGHTTDFEDQIQSMQVDNKPVENAGPGALIGIKVKDRVREKDLVYKVTD